MWDTNTVPANGNHRYYLNLAYVIIAKRHFRSFCSIVFIP